LKINVGTTTSVHFLPPTFITHQHCMHDIDIGALSVRHVPVLCRNAIRILTISSPHH